MRYVWFPVLLFVILFFVFGSLQYMGVMERRKMFKTLLLAGFWAVGAAAVVALVVLAITLGF